MQRLRQGIERGFAKDPGSLSADECAVVEGYEVSAARASPAARLPLRATRARGARCPSGCRARLLRSSVPVPLRCWLAASQGKGFSSGVASFCHRSLNLAHSRAAKEAIAGLSSTEASESDTAWTLAMISAVRDLAALP